MQSVRNVANHSRTVVCTIHSPSEAVFGLFDKLILLSMGRQTYYGPAKDAVAYFSQPGLGWTMPQGENPAEFLIQASEVRAIRVLQDNIMGPQLTHHVYGGGGGVTGLSGQH